MQNKPFSPGSSFTFIAQSDDAGSRLDRYLALQFPLYTRSFLQGIIRDGLVSINQGIITKSGTTLKTNDTIEIKFPPSANHYYAQISFEKDPVVTHSLGIEVVFEHPHFLIINKPAGVIVHKPNHYSTEKTVVDWIISHYHDIESVGYIDRPGIVHRLDKGTSGLLIIPRTNYAHAIFGDLFKNRHIHKTYLAIVKGSPEKQGTIDYALDRHPHVRIKRHHFDKSLLQQPGHESLRSALTHFKVVTYYQNAALVEAKPVTGRTHQIRVHMAAIGHPLIGDTVYGSASSLIKRHALHAHALEFTFDGTAFKFELPLPDDMKSLKDLLAQKNS